MTSRERVRIALRHEEPDMVPVDFGGMRSTGINAVAYKALKSYLKIDQDDIRIFDIFQQLAEPEEPVRKIMGADVVELHRFAPAFGIPIDRWKKGSMTDDSECLVPYGFNPVVNAQGDLEIVEGDTVIARMPKGGHYFDIVDHPYSNVQNLEDIAKIPVPEMSDEELAFLKEQAKTLFTKTEYAILGAFGGNMLEAGQMDWGYEEFYTAMALNPEWVHDYLERKTEAYLRDLKRYLAAVGEYIDVIQFGDDLGTQENLQVSVPMYRELIKPYHRRLYSYVRNNYPHVKVFLHSCGAISELIPDLIDAGVEVLNPVQLSARNMDPRKLKKEFGRHLTFWGGGCNTQTTATFGSISDIEREVEELMGIFSPGGGFVFTQVHNLQANISPEKIMAIYNTANRCRKYRT